MRMGWGFFAFFFFFGLLSGRLFGSSNVSEKVYLLFTPATESKYDLPYLHFRIEFSCQCVVEHCHYH